MKNPCQPERLILASSSPRRRELLTEFGYRFESVTPHIEELETRRPHVGPAAHASSLAYFKASAVASLIRGATVLGADTIATLDDEIIGKPKDRDDARRILRRLSGTAHDVITGVALVDCESGRRMIEHDVTRIRVRPLADDVLETYLDTGLWEGKAGAYGIQDEGDPFVETMDGSYSNVVGLPMELVVRMLKAWSV